MKLMNHTEARETINNTINLSIAGNKPDEQM